MKYPLTIEQFRNESEFENGADKEFIQLFISAVNHAYETGKRVKNSGFCFTVNMLKAWEKRCCGKEFKRKEEKMLNAYTEYANDAYQQGVRDSGEVVEISTDAIKIYPCFAAHPPKAEKMEWKEQYFIETGLLQSQIILDSQGKLIDGYTSYLLAVKHGIDNMFVKYGKRQIVRASHKSGGKLYVWELPWNLIDRVHMGDKVLVRTKNGVRAVIVSEVVDYSGKEPEPFKMVIRVKRRKVEVI